MSAVTVKTVTMNDTGEKKIRVDSPFHPDLASRAKKLGGAWDGGNKCWRFDVRDEARVRALCKELYGTDGSPAASGDLVTVKASVKEAFYVDKGGVFLAGRCLAVAFSRDSGARLGEGVIVLAGSFGSGGSVKNWDTRIRTGTVVEIRDVPRAAAENLSAEELEHWYVEILSNGTDKKDALCVERAALVARLTEIDRELSELSDPS